MAKKVSGYIKLQIPAGKATPVPPVGPALGQHGVNIMAFTLSLSDPKKEVSAEEVERVVKKILGNLKFKLGIEIR